MPEKAEWPPRKAVSPAAQPAFCRTERKQWPPREKSRFFRRKGPIGACLEDGDAGRRYFIIKKEPSSLFSGKKIIFASLFNSVYGFIDIDSYISRRRAI